LVVSWAGTLYIHYAGLLPHNGILPGAKFTLRPSLALSYIGSVNARHSSSGCQTNFAALSRGRHLYSAGRLSRWALAIILVFSWLVSRGVNCGRTAGPIEMPLGKNFRRSQIFSLEISGPKWSYFVNFRCTGRSGPYRDPGPEASASPASWMIRPRFRTKWHINPFSRLATTDMGRKLGEVLGPHLTQCRRVEAHLHTKWHLGLSNRLAAIIIIIIIIRTFVTRAVSANILNLRRRQSLGEEDGGSEV